MPSVFIPASAVMCRQRALRPKMSKWVASSPCQYSSTSRRNHSANSSPGQMWHFAPELLTGVRQAGVPLDNNPAERDLRPLVIARKISGGTRSPRGSSTRMGLSTLFATWSAQGRDPLVECRQLLQSPLPHI